MLQGAVVENNDNNVNAFANAVLQVLQANQNIPQHLGSVLELSPQAKAFAKLCGKWLFPFFGNTLNYEQICTIGEVHNIARMFVSSSSVESRWCHEYTNLISRSQELMHMFGTKARSSTGPYLSRRNIVWHTIMYAAFQHPVTSEADPIAKLLKVPSGKSVFGRHSNNPSFEGLSDIINGKTGNLASYFFTRAFKAHHLDELWATNTPETTAGYRPVSEESVYSPLYYHLLLLYIRHVLCLEPFIKKLCETKTWADIRAISLTGGMKIDGRTCQYSLFGPSFMASFDLLMEILVTYKPKGQINGEKRKDYVQLDKGTFFVDRIEKYLFASKDVHGNRMTGALFPLIVLSLRSFQCQSLRSFQCADAQGRRINVWEERHQLGFEKYIYKPLHSNRGPPVEVININDADREIVVPPPPPAGAVAPPAAAANAPAPAAARPAPAAARPAPAHAAARPAPAPAAAALAPVRPVVREAPSPPAARERSPPGRSQPRQDSSDEEEDDDEDAGRSPTPSPQRSPSPVCTYSKCIKGEGCIRKGSALETCGLCKTMSVHSACMPGFRRFGKFLHLYSHLRTAVLCFECASNVVNDAMRDVQAPRGKGARVGQSHSAKRKASAASSGGGSKARSRR